MKDLRKLCCIGLAVVCSAPYAAWSQVPTIPGAAGFAGVPPALPATPAAGAAAPAATPGRNLWTFLCPPPELMARKKAKFCNSMIGKLFNNMMGPMSVFTGRVLGQCCPPIDPLGLAMPPDSPLGAAAQVQKDTAQAAARRAAIRYLSTVNCNYWPEVRAALINGLRADKNECVRLEVALALDRG